MDQMSPHISSPLDQSPFMSPSKPCQGRPRVFERIKCKHCVHVLWGCDPVNSSTDQGLLYTELSRALGESGVRCRRVRPRCLAAEEANSESERASEKLRSGVKARKDLLKAASSLRRSCVTSLTSRHPSFDGTRSQEWPLITKNKTPVAGRLVIRCTSGWACYLLRQTGGTMLYPNLEMSGFVATGLQIRSADFPLPP